MHHGTFGQFIYLLYWGLQLNNKCKQFNKCCTCGADLKASDSRGMCKKCDDFLDKALGFKRWKYAED